MSFGGWQQLGHPDGQDVYHDRWNEVVPGHPLSSERDEPISYVGVRRAVLDSLGFLLNKDHPQQQQNKPLAAACTHERTTTQGSNAHSAS